MAKNGELRTVINSKQDESWFSCKYVKDIFISIITLNWWWISLMFSSAFCGSWLIFALIWYLIFWVHGDFEQSNMNDSDFTSCASAIVDFTSCFLFSGKVY